MKRSILRDVRGVTVAEVIVALAVVTVGLLGLMTVMPLSTAHIAEANWTTIAVFLAQQRLEQIKNAQWTTAPNVDQLGGAGSNGNDAVTVAGFASRWPDETAVAGYPTFQRQVRIRDCSVAPGCGIATDATLATLRQVTVTVTFSRMTGLGTRDASAPAAVRLVTYLTRS